MAKPAAAGGAAAPDKKGKKKTFKKKERKHVPHGLVHVQASFNNTIVTIPTCRQRAVVEEFGIARLPRIAQGHSVRRAAGRLERRQHGARSRRAQRGRPRQRSGFGPRVGSPRAGRGGNRSAFHSDVTPIPHNGCRPPKRRRV
jgi:small subunit ribosomal protein S11